MYKIIFYLTPRNDSPVEDFIETLDEKLQARIYQSFNLLKQEGPNLLRPYADPVRGKIRELRVQFSSTNIRIFYFFFLKNNIVLLHAFKKKTQRLPEKEIARAEKNMANWMEREEKSSLRNKKT